MTISQQIITISAVVLGTMITRFLPFILFSGNKPTPRYVKHLGIVLPSAVLGMLAVYSLKDINLMEGTRGIPELIAVMAVVILHFWKRQMLISIAAGTIIYMLLIQFIF